MEGCKIDSFFFFVTSDEGEYPKKGFMSFTGSQTGSFCGISAYVESPRSIYIAERQCR